MMPEINDPREIPGNPRRVKEMIEFVDPHAATLRRRAGVGPTERLDPWAVAPTFDLEFVRPENVPDATDEDRALVSDLTAKQWSGMGLPLPDGRLLVMLNPNQTPERCNVTIMEEVAHVHLGHKPVALISSTGGGVQRHYDKVTEQEAYWLAAATLLPTPVVGRAVWNGLTVGQLAESFGVSIELAGFRIKVLRLWPDYQKRQRERRQEETV